VPARIAAGGALPQTALGFPVYDTHGNSVGMVSLTGILAYERTYSPWGEVVSSTGSPPQQGYCANLGHRGDTESGLIYMRARYYEPSSGRFLTEDPAKDGINWYGYCANDPVSRVDADGRSSLFADVMVGAWFVYFVVQFLRGDDYDAGSWQRFGIALLILGSVTAAHELGYSERYLTRTARLARVWSHRGLYTNVYGERVRTPSRGSYIAAFYMGYALALLYIHEELSDWVEQG